MVCQIPVGIPGGELSTGISILLTGTSTLGDNTPALGSQENQHVILQPGVTLSSLSPTYHNHSPLSSCDPGLIKKLGTNSGSTLNLVAMAIIIPKEIR